MTTQEKPASTTARPAKKRKAAVRASVSNSNPSSDPKPLRPYLVGIGASAGGLEALSSLIAVLPTDLGISYVVLQHLSPTHRSMMVQLLGRETAMAVLEVEDGAQPQPDTIYVAPASHNVVLRDGSFALVEGPPETRPAPFGQRVPDFARSGKNRGCHRRDPVRHRKRRRGRPARHQGGGRLHLRTGYADRKICGHAPIGDRHRLRGLGAASGRHRQRNLRHCAFARHRHGGPGPDAGGSIGICMYPNDGEDAETLLKNADSAMYKAKDGGKKTHHFFTEELKRTADERLKMETNLRSAIAQGNIFLEFQPQWDIAGKRMIGVEVLARWRHAGELISPAKFIALAEKIGLMGQLGEWIASAACHQLAGWIKSGYDVPRISINVSAEQFKRGNVSAMMLRLLSQHRLDASRLILELTESALLDDVEGGYQVLQELKALGVKISIDDFGIGYSSLAYLRRLPISELKIPREFIENIVDSEEERSIARTILSMARTMGFSVVAEGVETEGQFGVLRDLGCDSVQGFLLAGPMTTEQLAESYFSK